MTLEGRQLKVNYAYLQIAEEIETQILDGKLKPGDRLPGEVELAQMFGVTRSTVREGLRQLEADGLVHRPTPRRLEVAEPQTDKLTTRSSRAMTMMKVSFRDLWQVAMVTEPLAAELAAQYRTEEELDDLSALHDRLCRARGIAEMIELDMQFHSAIAEMSKNQVLILARDPITRMLFSGFQRVAPAAPNAARRQAEAHGAVLDHIAAGDAEGARDWARRHIEDFRRAIDLAGLMEDTPF